jgi:hypothetical protein
MNAFIEKTFFSAPTGDLHKSRYVRLALLSGLLVCTTALVLAQRHWTFDRALVPVLTLALLFQHLASEFRWRRGVFVTLRVLQIVSFICLIIYFCACFASWVHH